MSAPLSDREMIARFTQEHEWQERSFRSHFDDQGQLRRLDLRSTHLFSFPAEIGQFAHLEYLNLSYNYLTRLPPQIGQLHSLRELYLDHNQLTRLPPEVGQLAHLSVLWLDHNRLTTLPPQIGQLTQLCSLSLGHNRLASLPAEIGQLSNLNDLYLYQNHLTHLPVEIGRLSRLEHLTLGKNPLAELPSEIGLLTNLWTFLLDEKLAAKFGDELDQLLMTPNRQEKEKSKTQQPIPLRSFTGNVLVAYSHFTLDNVEYPSEKLEQLDGTAIPTWMLVWPKTPTSVNSAGNDHIVSVRLEVWGQEPPPPKEIWDESCTLSVQVSYETIALVDGYGSSYDKTFLIGEPGLYHLRGFRHVRPAISQALDRAREEGSKSDDDHATPENMECYLFQFWEP